MVPAGKTANKMRGTAQWIVLVLLALPCVLLAAERQPDGVEVKKQGDVYILHNAYLTAEINRTTGDLTSLKYDGVEMMGYVSGHHAGYWEQNPSNAARLSDGVSIDPAQNGSARAEVYVKGVAEGRSILRGNGPGMICDLEIRYSLGKEDHGIYTYAIFSHSAGYPATAVDESRFGMKLNGSLFDWLSIDAQRDLLMPSGYDWDHGQPMNMKEARRLTTGAFAGKVEHKYDYSANQFDTPVFGWSSTKKHIGIFLVNPSAEYLSGGATKVELTGHLDGSPGADPTLLDYWRSTHYGGSSLELAAGEAWTKVIGPILVYVNSGPTPQALFADAKREAKRQQDSWPFAWVQGVDYPALDQRAAVQGRLTIHDTQPASMPPSTMLVGLIPVGEGDGTWQRDAKHYQFWIHAQQDGSFILPKVRPGTYELHALADGVFGEYSGPTVSLAAGQTLKLGELAWVPVRYGKQLWEIGIPNRSGSEFFMGDRYFHWGMYLLYAKLFPDDVTYTIGKSDFRRDWYFEEVPNVGHGAGGNNFNGGDTVWRIFFALDAPLAGQVVLRTGICGAAASHVLVTVNGKPAGDLAPLAYNATINRDGIAGTWSEHDVRFPATLLKAGNNELDLTVPAGNAMSGVIYDYLRLETDEGHAASP